MSEAALKLVQPEIQELERKSTSIVDQAKDLQVTNKIEYEAAGGILLSIKDTRKEIAATFGPIKSKQYDAWKETVAQEKRHDEPLIQAEAIIKNKIAEYAIEQERIRREEEARLMAELKKKEEEERLAQAIIAEQSGEKEQAEQILNEPAYVAPVVVPTAIPKMSGISTRQVWHFQIIDPKKVPDQYKVIDERKIAGVVRSLGANANIPGVKVFQKSVVAAGRR